MPPVRWPRRLLHAAKSHPRVVLADLLAGSGLGLVAGSARARRLVDHSRALGGVAGSPTRGHGALYGVGGTAFGLAIRSIGFSLSPASQQLMISEQPIHAVIPRLDVNFRLPTGSCRAVTDQNRKAFG